MSFRQIHLHLRPHPAPTSLRTVDYACAFAHHFEAKLSVSSPRVSVKTPVHWLAGRMLTELAGELEAIAAKKGSDLEARICQSASSLGVDLQIDRLVEHWPASLGESTWRGRTSDLCVLGLTRENPDHRLNIEDWLFGVGRPCLFYPDDAQSEFSLDCVVVSWDFSKSAARALGDALPLLQRAKQVRIATVRGEKDLPFDDVKTPLIDFLAAHGIASVGDDIDLGGHSIGQAILAHASSVGANLIVMGAFGHSRMKEFLLGGATKEVLDRSTLPLFMSH
jgi:nucleotide-binding universal stress UspA family protein